MNDYASDMFLDSIEFLDLFPGVCVCVQLPNDGHAHLERNISNSCSPVAKKGSRVEFSKVFLNVCFSYIFFTKQHHNIMGKIYA